MNRSISYRIILDILILLSVIQGWWFIALPIALMAAWLFPLYIEIMLAGLMYDSLFAPSQSLESYMGTIVAVVIFLAMILAKKIVRRSEFA